MSNQKFHHGKDFNEILKSIYYNIENIHSFSSVQKLLKSAKEVNPQINEKTVKDWLKKQNLYTTHRYIKRKFNRNKIVISKIDQQWQIDLIDFTRISKFNDNINYLLVCIDVLSKYLWVKPLKNKNSNSVEYAFNSIIKESNRKPQTIFSDPGSKLYY